MSDELKASRLKADYAEKMLHTANRQLDELTRAHAEVLDTLDDLLDKYSVHNRASVGAQLVSVQHILTDLIAELREWSDSELLNPDTELHVNRMADRAEVRLRDVSMSLSKGHDHD